MKRRVAVITGTRAEFGLLEPMLRAMRSDPRLDPRLIVTGMHLLPKFGRTINDIRRAGWPIEATVRMQSGRDAADEEPLALSRGIAGISRALQRMRAEMVLVLGDRVEAFAGACAAAAGRHFLVHVHGGDRGVGDIDDILRNAITRLAYLHLVASRDAAERLKLMGEEPWRIHRIGAPGLDDIREALLQSERRSSAKNTQVARHSVTPDQPYAVIVQHPCGRGAAHERGVMRNILGAVRACGLCGVILHPNSDPGHDGILHEILSCGCITLKGERLARGSEYLAPGGGRLARHVWDRHPAGHRPPRGVAATGGEHLAHRSDCTPQFVSIASLPRPDYLRLVAGAAFLIGNSSSGIIESASLGVNAVNVGPRQEGRLKCGPNVIDASESCTAITRAIRKALDMPRPQPRRSVYGDGRAGQRAASILAALKLTPRWLRKQLAY